MSESQKKHGCLFYTFICLLVLIALILGGVYYTYRTTIVPYLSTEPQITQTTTLQPDVARDLTYNFNKQVQAIKEKQETTIKYTQDEFNYLMNHNEFFDNVSSEFAFHPNKVTVKGTIPVSNKYLNFEGDINTNLSEENNDENKSVFVIKGANTNEENNDKKIEIELKEVLASLKETYKVEIKDLKVEEGSVSVTISPIK